MTHCRSENTSSSKAKTASAWGGSPLPSRLSQQLLLELGDKRKQVREALGSLDLILSCDFPPRRDVLHWQFRWQAVGVGGRGGGGGWETCRSQKTSLVLLSLARCYPRKPVVRFTEGKWVEFYLTSLVLLLSALNVALSGLCFTTLAFAATRSLLILFNPFLWHKFKTLPFSCLPK